MEISITEMPEAHFPSAYGGAVPGQNPQTRVNASCLVSLNLVQQPALLRRQH